MEDNEETIQKSTFYPPNRLLKIWTELKRGTIGNFDRLKKGISQGEPGSQQRLNDLISYYNSHEISPFED